MTDYKQCKVLSDYDIVEVPYNKTIEKNRLDAIKALDYIHKNKPYLDDRTNELIPEYIYYMVYYRVIDKAIVEGYKANNKDRSEKANDSRTNEQACFNHLIGFIYECIAQAILEEQGFIVERFGCDKDITKINYTITNEPDLKAINSKGQELLIDIQKGINTKYKTIGVKESKIKGLLKYGVIYMLWIDNNEEGIYYTVNTFRNVDEVIYKYNTYVKNGIGGKPTYNFSYNDKYLKCV